MISYPYCLLLQVCKTTLSYLLLSLFTIFVCHINLLAVCQHPFWFFLKDFYVGILDAVSLCTVMYVRVRSFTFGYPQTLHMRDPHQELLLLLFIFFSLLAFISVFKILHNDINFTSNLHDSHSNSLSQPNSSLPFHQFYFNLPTHATPQNSTPYSFITFPYLNFSHPFLQFFISPIRRTIIYLHYHSFISNLSFFLSTRTVNSSIVKELSNPPILPTNWF